MVMSMTGYGRAVIENDVRKVIVELRSLNSKSMDIQLKMPSIYKEREMELRTDLSQKLERGKLECIIDVTDKKEDLNLAINREMFKSYYRQFEEIASELNHNIFDIEVFQLIMRMPEIISISDKVLDEQEWKNVSEACDLAIEELIKFRIQEGQALEKDFIKRVSAIENLLIQIPAFEKERIENLRDRIKSALEELKGIELDRNRFEQELIYYLEKLDITEEKVRLKNHCKYFVDTLKEGNHNGKKLGFISQEMGREINTLGAKANDYNIQKIVVQMKDELEKVKEQLMNIL